MRKVITMGSSPFVAPEECRRRLKRWFIMGANTEVEKTFDADTKRSAHLEYGGYRLRDLASDSCVDTGLYGAPDEELDRLCELY